MKKIRKSDKVNYLLEWKGGVEISQIKKDIEELEKLGATHVDIDIDYYYGDASLEIKVLSKRLETDEEYQQRMNEDNKRQEEIKKRDLEQLEKLKLKYNL